MATVEAVRERPVLFSGPMILAIREGRKTQTRRVVKPQPKSRAAWHGVEGPEDALKDVWYFGHNEFPHASNCMRACPYGEPGDRLWVRETWAANAFLNLRKPTELKGETIYYRATYDNDSHFMWRPSIHMPRWASRILLEITDVKAERLNDISGDDLEAEGFPRDDSPPHDGTRLTEHGRRMCFAELWESINGPGSWDANPFVWVIGFRRID